MKTSALEPWKQKSHKVIYSLCRQSYEFNNVSKSGRKSSRHIPYSVPQEAQDLIDCLNTNNEEKAKAMFLFNYKIKNLQVA